MRGGSRRRWHQWLGKNLEAAWQVLAPHDTEHQKWYCYSSKRCLKVAELDDSNTILIIKPAGADATAPLRSKHNTRRLISFHFEHSVSSILGFEVVMNAHPTYRAFLSSSFIYNSTQDRNMPRRVAPLEPAIKGATSSCYKP